MYDSMKTLTVISRDNKTVILNKDKEEIPINEVMRINSLLDSFDRDNMTQQNLYILKELKKLGAIKFKYEIYRISDKNNEDDYIITIDLGSDIIDKIKDSEELKNSEIFKVLKFIKISSNKTKERTTND